MIQPYSVINSLITAYMHYLPDSCISHHYQ